MNTQIYDQGAEWFIEFRTGELDASTGKVFFRHGSRDAEFVGDLLV